VRAYHGTTNKQSWYLKTNEVGNTALTLTTAAAAAAAALCAAAAASTCEMYDVLLLFLFPRWRFVVRSSPISI